MPQKKSYPDNLSKKRVGCSVKWTFGMV